MVSRVHTQREADPAFVKGTENSEEGETIDCTHGSAAPPPSESESDSPLCSIAAWLTKRQWPSNEPTVVVATRILNIYVWHREAPHNCQSQHVAKRAQHRVAKRTPRLALRPVEAKHTKKNIKTMCNNASFASEKTRMIWAYLVENAAAKTVTTARPCLAFLATFLPLEHVERTSTPKSLA